MLAGARAVLSDSPSYACAHPASLLAGVGYSIGRAMGGTSGVLYSIFFSAVAASVLGMRLTQAPTPAQMAEAFAAGVEAVGR
jgi:dihydroxyacetone kinase